MLAATRMKMSERHFLHKTNNQEVSRSFTLKSCKTTAKKCTKKVCCSCKVAFLLIRPIVVFFTVLVISIYRARTRTRTSSQDSSQNSTIFHFSPSPLRGGFSWQSWKESSSQCQGQVRVKARVRVRVRLGLCQGQELTSYVRSPFCCFDFTFVYQIRQVLTGVLAQVQARSPGSSPGRSLAWL